MPLSGFHPLIAEWFTRRFQSVTEPQALGWPEIRAGRDVLISAPTGAGKTLAAFLICLDRLLRDAEAGHLQECTDVVYVSPLRALSNDICRNLEVPLAEMTDLADSKGLGFPSIRIALRTGDTPAWERRRMLEEPPHVLVTTPESLFILLTAGKSREFLRTARGRQGALLHRDQVNGRVRGRRHARLTAITSGGAIPETANYVAVAEPEGTHIGTLDEEFAVESMVGDVFLLGTTSWRIRRVEPGRVRVENAHGAAPSVPFWRGEAPGRTIELSRELSRLREEISPASVAGFGLDRLGSAQVLGYLAAGKAALGIIPTVRTVVAERFFDEAGGMQLVLHAPFGSRINRAWGLALRKRFCRSFNLELQAAATDNGIVISLTEQHSFPLELVFEFLDPDTVEPVLTQALLDAPMFTARWRWNVTRALAVPRFRGGKKVPPPIQRMRADDLLAAVFPDQAACAENLAGEVRIPDHPLINETVRNCLHEAMDLDGLKDVLAAIRSGDIRTVAVDTPSPSPFCHEILNANPYAHLDDAPMEERRARAVQLRRILPPDVAAGVGALDPAAIAEVASESWPVVRDPDELHDALLTLAALPPVPEWEPFFHHLVEARRAALLRAASFAAWVPAERVGLALKAWPDASLSPAISQPPSPRPAPESREACVAEILRGWLDSSGPMTASELSRRLGLDAPLIDAALLQIEVEGQVLRGRFTPGRTETEWCQRRLLARIHHLTLGRLRREIEPVPTVEFLRFLSRWQHLAPGTQLHGVDGAFQVIRQLQGFELPAAAWESQVLPRRLARYNPGLLDELCLSGELMWGRLSPHPAFEAAQPRRVRPTRLAPIALFLREDADWLVPAGAAEPPALSHPASDVYECIQRRGASFFTELTRASGRLPSEVEDALWELFAAGLVTADSFENLRALVDPKRRRGQGSGRRARPRHAAGRWALLRFHHPAPREESYARQLLLRWGIVFRDLLVRESLAPPWRDLLLIYRRMEARGEIRGGRFAAAYLGEQFALPEALALLRALRREPPPDRHLEISPADPLHFAGILRLPC